MSSQDILLDPCVRANPDGTYTIVDPAGLDDDWTVRDTGGGWEATHRRDGFEGDLFASAADAVTAVLADPANARRVGGAR